MITYIFVKLLNDKGNIQRRQNVKINLFFKNFFFSKTQIVFRMQS